MLNTNLINRIQSICPSLIFFDIDGTLLNTQGHYSPELKQQLLRLQAQGVKLAIASGRPAIAAQFLFDDLPLTDAGLFCTGAELYEPKQQRVLQHHLLDVQVLQLLFQQVYEMELYCECYTPDYYTFDQDYWQYDNDALDVCKTHSEHLRVEPTNSSTKYVIEQCLPVTKLLLGVNEKARGNQLAELEKAFPQLTFAYAHFLPQPGWLFASVVNASADKYQGFARLLDYHGVTATNVVAFGDSHSDRVFLQQAGLGVAMGNASDSVKNIADIVTVSADKNGVAEVLKYF